MRIYCLTMYEIDQNRVSLTYYQILNKKRHCQIDSLQNCSSLALFFLNISSLQIARNRK